MTLEEALTKVAKDNDFTSVEVGRMLVEDRVVWTASVHWNGHTLRGITCASGHSDTSIQEALFLAIEAAATDRKPLAAMPLKLPSFVVAA